MRPPFTPPMPRTSVLALLLAGICLAAPHAMRAAAPAVNPPASSAAGGVIEGRVLNPASGEYLGNAEVRIEGTEIRAVTQSDGRYRLVNVPAGNVTVRVSYTGYESAVATVERRKFSTTSCASRIDSKR